MRVSTGHLAMTQDSLDAFVDRKEKDIKNDIKEISYVCEMKRESDRNGEMDGLKKGMPARNWKSTTVPNKGNYMMVVVRENQAHAVPVKRVWQMRPTLEDIDARNAGKEQKEDYEMDMDEEKMVQVQVKKKDSERVAELKKNSFAAMKAEMEADSWVELKWLNSSTPEAQNKYEMVICGDSEIIRFNKKLSDVVDMCTLPPREFVGNVNPSLVTHDQLPFMKLDERLKVLFSNSPVIQYKQLMGIHVLLPSENESYLLNELEKIACCIQGCWVVKSSLRFTGYLKFVRDFLLSMFSHNRVVYREDFNEKVSVDLDRATRMFEEVSVIVEGDRSWEFRLETDYEFIDNHPEIIKRQTELLKSVEKAAIDGIQALKESVIKAQAVASSQSSVRNAVDEGMRLHLFLEQRFVSFGVCSVSFLLSEFVQEKNGPDHAFESISDVDFMDRIRATYLLLCSPDLYCRKSLQNSTLNRFRQVLIEYLLTTGPHVALQKPQIQALYDEKVGEQISESDYTRINKEFMVYDKGFWKLKCGNY